MTHLVFRPEVEADVKESQSWYEERRSGLGGEFFEAFEEALEVLAANPYRSPPLYRDVRCGRLKRFPYGIYYYIFRDNVVVVLAVHHHSRDPQVWQARR